MVGGERPILVDIFGQNDLRFCKNGDFQAEAIFSRRISAITLSEKSLHH